MDESGVARGGPVLPELHHQAARATARLVLSAARGTARKVRRGRCGWMTQV
ncbi:hypothetical protein ACGFIJ_35480 [Microbispora bryophytorum]|uniref:hypothetical protein n=1 Tax=Microbispora bryophytorum TaxID=1460882 RepID=UPI003712A098